MKIIKVAGPPATYVAEIRSDGTVNWTLNAGAARQFTDSDPLLMRAVSFLRDVGHADCHAIDLPAPELAELVEMPLEACRRASKIPR